MLTMRLNHLEYKLLRDCQFRLRDDCHAAFTAIPTGEIWPFATWGRTPNEQRENVRGELPHLDRIADELLECRCDGGRFFVLERSVIYRIEPEDIDGVRFVALQIEGDVIVAIP
jgi:hypothetical protein